MINYSNASQEINGLCPDAFSSVCIDKYMYHQWEEIMINDDCISKPFFGMEMRKAAQKC